MVDKAAKNREDRTFQPGGAAPAPHLLFLVDTLKSLPYSGAIDWRRKEGI